MNKQKTGQYGSCHRAAEPFPGFTRTDAWDHFVTPNEGTDRVCAAVAGLGDQYEIEQIIMALDVRKKVDLLDEIQQPGHIHQAKQGRGNSQDTGGVAAGKELAQAKAEYEKN